MHIFIFLYFFAAEGTTMMENALKLPVQQARWRISKWSPCSTTCGKGMQTRSIYCKGAFSPSPMRRRPRSPTPPPRCPQPESRNRRLAERQVVAPLYMCAAPRNDFRELVTVEGSSVYMWCTAYNVKFAWLKEGERIVADGRYKLGNGYFNISNVRISDSGQYACLSHTGEKLGFQLIVKNLEWFYKETVLVDYGTTVLVECQEQYSYTAWKKNGVPIRFGSVEKTLVLKNFTSADCGLYECYYESPPTSSSDVKVFSGELLLFGEKVRLPCIDEEAVTWLKDGTVIDSKCDIMKDGSLYLGAVTMLEIGVYTCFYRGEMKQNHSVDVAEPPAITRLVSRSPGDLFVGSSALVSCADSLTIRCEAIGYPRPTNKWNVDGIPLSSVRHPRARLEPDGSLRLTNIQPKDQGTYQCNASNTVGFSVMETEVKVRIALCPKAPNISRTSEEMKKVSSRALLGNVAMEKIAVQLKWNLLIDCIASGSPVPLITWRRPDGRLVERTGRIRQPRHGRLRIGGVRRDDAGSYTCTARNWVGRDSVRVNVTVRNPPKPVVFDGRTGGKVRTAISFAEGEELRLVCRDVADAESRLSWVGENDVESFYRYSALVLRRKMSSKLIGSYRCAAESAVGSLVTSAAVDVTMKPLEFTVQPSFSIEIDGLPVSIFSSKTVLIDDGSSFTISCACTDASSLEWLKDGASVDSSVRRRIHTAWQNDDATSSLTFARFSSNDAGVYTCSISNSFISKTSSVTISVKGLPVIGASSQFSKINGVEKYVSIGNDATIRVGENVALYCMSVGEPPLSISVFRNGVPLRQLTSTSSILSLILALMNVALKPATTYECRVNNARGFASKKSVVNVIAAPTIALFRGRQRVRSSLDVALNSSVSVDCVVTGGRPTPVVRWEMDRGRRVVNSDNRVRAMPLASLKSRLIIDAMTIADAKTYTCVAENEAEAVSSDIQILALAGNDAFNFSYPDLDSAEAPPDESEANRYDDYDDDELDDLKWSTVDRAGRVTLYDASAEWTAPEEEEENEEELVSGARTIGDDEKARCERRATARRQSRGIVDQDDRMEIDNTTRYPVKATGVVFYSNPSDPGESRFCTGTLINVRHVLTAAHCISDGNGHFYSNITFAPAANGKASIPLPYGAIPWEKLMTVAGYHYKRLTGYDYGLIVLAKGPGHFMPFMRGRFLLRNPVPSPLVSINQYPIDKENGGVPVMVYANCSVGRPLYRNLTISHTCDTAGGASGSGMYASYRKKPQPAVALIHTGRLFSTGDNRALVIDKAKYWQLCRWIESTGGIVEDGCRARFAKKRNKEVTVAAGTN